MILLSIQGMTCTSCATHIRDTLQAIGGVERAAVSFEKASAEVVTDGSVNAADLMGVIESLGYTAQEKNGQASGSTSKNRDASGEKASPHVVIIGSGSGAFACAIKAAEGGGQESLSSKGAM